MLRNKKTTKRGRVEFVSYTGKYPNLCRGVLTLKIDGTEYKFGHDYSLPHSYDKDGNFILADNDNYPSFWASGGSAYFNHDMSESFTDSGEWDIDVDELPEKFWDVAEEIDEVFNENVEYGCCGGCL